MDKKMQQLVDGIKAAEKNNQVGLLSELLEVNDLVVIGWALDAMIARYDEADKAATEAGNSNFSEKAARIKARITSIRNAVRDLL